MWDSTTLASASLLMATIALVLRKRWCRETPLPPLPPSPRSYPIIGNLLSMPSRDEHLGFIEIGKQLDVKTFSLSVFGTVIVVLNSLEDAVNLLETRSSIYSDRPRIPMVVEPSLLDWAGVPTLLPYGDRWRMTRRMMHRWLRREPAVAFQPSQQHQALLLLQRLLGMSDQLSSSKELELEIYRTMASTIIYSAYGRKIESRNDPFLLEAKIAVENLTRACLASNFMVNSFPVLNRLPDWFPGTGWKKTAKEWREQAKNAVNRPYNWAKNEMDKTTHEPSMVESMLGQAEQLGVEPSEVDDFVKEVAFILFGAGTDTTTNTIMVFFTAMLLFPEAQKKAQREIDLVIGQERLPTMEDRARLPYIERLIQELLRWRPIVPNGGPHACYKDDVYKGYRIPKGAIVIANIWAMCHDANVYKDPETFEPDRFLDPSIPAPPTFGFGRRICPGIHYAGSSLFICITSILATFNIEMARDERGTEIVPLPLGENSLIYYPVPFKLKLVPRSPLHGQLILDGA
ncbi:hypothetical protein FS749_016223 [Ceratobasidium sp. UAMH 11750]|nr:hypothetical protein FS749_016223 [Ceratobasidium sp. UAMH 11750]